MCVFLFRRTNCELRRTKFGDSNCSSFAFFGENFTPEDVTAFGGDWRQNFADVAQLVEQGFCKPQVGGSSPFVGSKILPAKEVVAGLNSR